MLLSLAIHGILPVLIAVIYITLLLLISREDHEKGIRHRFGRLYIIIFFYLLIGIYQSVEYFVILSQVIGASNLVDTFIEAFGREAFYNLYFLHVWEILALNSACKIRINEIEISKLLKK